MAILCLCIATAGVFADSQAEPKPFQIPNSDTFSITDKKTSRPYNLYIQLPKDYSPTIKYPVIYMTDAWYTFPVIAGSLIVPVGADKMRSVILVGISEQTDLSIEDSRIRDYTPTTLSSWKSKTGESKTHLDYIRRQVIPYIENKYSTDPSQRTYIGLSLGGLFGAYILMTHPDTFSNYILASPSLWYDNELLLKMEKAYAEKHNDLEANVYISVGSHETPEHKETINNMINVANNFYVALDKRNYKSLKLEMKLVDSANHHTSFPTSAIQGLYRLFKNE